MGLDELIDGLHALLDEHEASRSQDPGEGNYGCEECVACYKCRFCVACDSCDDCTYCEECVECSGCTQSKRCLTCEQCSYSEDSRSCEESRYLTLCVDCKDCTHCLGCVGLKGAEFHVLNEKLPRKEYYELLKRVREAILVRMESGWRPEAIGLEAPPEPEPDPDPLGELDAMPEGLLRGFEGEGAGQNPVSGAKDREGGYDEDDDEDDPWLPDDMSELGAHSDASEASPYAGHSGNPREREAHDGAPVTRRPTLARGGRPARSDAAAEQTPSEEVDEASPREPGPGLRRGRRPNRS